MTKNNPIKRHLSLLILLLWPLLATCATDQPSPPQISVFPYPQTLSQAILPITGSKTAGATILVNGKPVAGYDSSNFFAIGIPLASGPNNFQLVAVNSFGNQSAAVSVSATLDTSAPNPPAVTNPSLSFGNSPFVITGTKDAGTDVLLNGKEIVRYNNMTAWSYSFTPTAAGNNTIQLASKNQRGVSSTPAALYVLDYLGSLLPSPPRSAPWPVAPLDGAEFQYASPGLIALQFTWTNTLSPTNRLQISATPDFASPFYDQQVMGFTFPYSGTLSAGNNYWRIGAVDAGGNVFYGPARKFHNGKVPGDLNGDGYADILIGAEGNYLTGANGTVSIYYGHGVSVNSGRPNSVPDLVLTGESPGDDFGSAIAVGDVNGDGYDDIMVGARRNSAGGFEAGRVYIYFGRPGGVINKPDMILTGFAPGEHFGVSLASGSDVNGDGYDDLLIGANLNSANGAWAGRAYLYYGGLKTLNIPDRVFTGEGAGDHFGIAVSMGGDINGDGIGDFLIGAGGDGTATHTGKAYLYYGGFVQGIVPDKTFASLVQGDGFGRMVKIIKDADGDGYSDFLIGAPYFPVGLLPGVGQAHLYLGGQNLTLAPKWTLSNPISSSNAYFGFSAAAIGDLPTDFSGNLSSSGSKDGYADWVIGAWGGTTSGSGNYPGWAATYTGSATLANAPPPSPGIINTGSNQNDAFGVAISSPGDFNGDGFSDLIVGAMYAVNSDGAAYFYDGHFFARPLPDGAGLVWPGTPGALAGFGFDVH